MVFTFTFTGVYQKINHDAILSAGMVSAVNQVENQKRLMLSHFNTIKSDLMFLPHLNEVLRFKEIETEEDRLLIENEFLKFITFSGDYDQLRYIDNLGMELIRADYNNGSPSLTTPDNLQNKRDRYYFSDTISIGDNRIYISPFDLNIEHGEIEQPEKPMIRFGTPVYNRRNEAIGIIILNFFGQIILDELIEATNTQTGSFSLINSDGYWLYSENAELEWGFMYNGKQDVNMEKKAPGLWKKISAADETQFIVNETLYTSTIIRPLKDERNIANNSQYILLNTIPFEELKIDKSSGNRALLKILGVVFIAGTILSALLSVLIVQRNKYRNELKESALYDQLTGLPNRKLLEERALQTANHAKRYKHIYAVMFIDLDGFKPVNDQYGHKAGDELLVQVGEMLINCVRETDTVARFGGDEFVILLSQINDKLDCSSVAQKILSKLFNDFNIEGNKIRIGASIGIASITAESETTFQQAMQYADSAMYEIKKTGKNNYKIVSF